MAHAVEVLCLHQTSQDPIAVHRLAIKLADDAWATATANKVKVNEYLGLMLAEAMLTQGSTFCSAPICSRCPSCRCLRCHLEHLTANALRAFSMLDKNEDRLIQKEEVPPGAWKQYSDFDFDQDDRLSTAEWMVANMIVTAPRESKLRKPSSAQLSLFNKLDTDRNEVVTKAELRRPGMSGLIGIPIKRSCQPGRVSPILLFGNGLFKHYSVPCAPRLSSKTAPRN